MWAEGKRSNRATYMSVPLEEILKRAAELAHLESRTSGLGVVKG